ncbi:MAG: hypothetical protein ACXVB9_07005 [Bdellovibrionota bacterium]
MIKLIILSFLFAVAGFCGDETELRILTTKDMYALSQRLEKAMRKCKEMRQRPSVSVNLENKTEEFIDKPQFASLIQSMLQLRTPVHPETETPAYDVHAVLSAKKRRIRLVTESTYSLAAELTKADEVLCKKTVKLTKHYESGTEEE